ncbi:hypothetical protein [Hoyosella subflava]|uniref:DUF8176 domain-containing protein n=1 Tax=Hoyosella subflava (strain DSM 45089 / JCM 17490 / NBRC 109087 / DQS3-9A1) TaxID=443218 RepID=F6ESH7_HOYSD|nr:hypothetical protein [Hoyosella subflava]AEF43098.1 hypothetical protein AS9A_P20054 [Hoyosella subflava DQS3-9A1]
MSTDFSDGGNDLFPDLAEDYSDDPLSEMAGAGSDTDSGLGAGFDLDAEFGTVRLGAGTGQIPAWVRAHIPSENLIDALAEQQQSANPTRKTLMLGAAGAAAVVLGVAGLVTVLGGGGDEPADITADAASTTAVSSPEVSAEPEPAPEPEEEFTPWCAPETTEYSLVSNGPGDPRTPVGVILAFQYAYYTDRDAARAASLMNPERSVEQLQAGIGEVPRGTDHCVTVSTTDRPQVFEVKMHLRAPSDDEGRFTQRVVVVPAGEEYRIASVEEVIGGA